MGWIGTVILGAVTGLVGWWLHPLRRARRARLWLALLAGVAGAMVARMAGNITGFFHDGDTLEWLSCTTGALIAAAVTVGLLSRR